jgi:hypothetical protein
MNLIRMPVFSRPGDRNSAQNGSRSLHLRTGNPGRPHYSAVVKFSRIASLSSSTLLRSPKVSLILYL